MTYLRMALILASILAALFSDKLDRIARGNGAVRMIILVFCGGIILVTLIPFIFLR